MYIDNNILIFSEKSRPKSSRSVTDKKDGKGKGKVVSGGEEDDEAALPPPPLQLSITVRLHHWNTAYDSVKEEEERNKATTNPPRAPASVKGDNWAENFKKILDVSKKTEKHC